MNEGNLYPSAPRLQISTTQEFRLGEIKRLKAFLEKEIEERLKYYGRYKKWAKVCSGLNGGLTGISLITGIGGIGVLTTIAGVPIAVVLEGIAIGSGITSIVVSCLSKKFDGKAEKHERICTLASSKLNTINDLVDKALEDSIISDSEYVLIAKEYEKYMDMKKTLKNGLVDSSSDLKKDIIKQLRKLDVRK